MGSLKRYWREHPRQAIFILVAGIFVSDAYLIPVHLWRLWSDDGHGIYTAPEDIDPAPVLAEPWPPIDPPERPLPRLSAADLATYFFPAGAQSDENGLAIRRFEAGEVAISASSKDDVPFAELAATLEPLVAPSGVPVSFVPKYSDEGRGLVAEDFPAISLYLGQRMNDLGCVGRPDFFHSGGHERDRLPREEAFVVRQAFIATYHRLDEPTVDHCLFKALLVALGCTRRRGFSSRRAR